MILYDLIYDIIFDIIWYVYIYMQLYWLFGFILSFGWAARYARWSGLDARLWAFDHSFFQSLFQVVSLNGYPLVNIQKPIENGHL